jgi:hypothetical protein
LAPDQSPLAVQLVGEFVADHVIVGLTTFTVPEVGDAEIVTTGIGGLTVTVALVFAEPPGPEHEIE